MIDLGDLQKNLVKKYAEGNLGSVYLALYPEQTDPKKWGQELLAQVTRTSDHPDILWVERGEDEKDYKVESPGILALLKFLNYRAYELKKKFIMINDAHLMSVIVSNKLLKVFEELPENFCLFLFSPQDQGLLPTVESRAIKILLPKDLSSEDYDAPLQEFASAQELIANLKKSEHPEHDEKRFIEDSLIKTLKSANYKECSDALESLKHFETSSDFNNSKLSRLSLFFK